MYKLLYTRPRKRNPQLNLDRGRQYIIGLTVKHPPTVNDLYILSTRCDLALDWFKLWEELIQTNDKCLYCGKPIKNEPFQRQKLYCNDDCRYEKMKKDRRDRNLRERYKKRLENDTLQTTYTKLGKQIPKEFNQIDNPRKLGETRLTKHIKTDT